MLCPRVKFISFKKRSDIACLFRHYDRTKQHRAFQIHMQEPQRVNEVNALLTGFMAERLRALGQENSGLHHFYITRLHKGEGLSQYDIALVRWVIAHCTPEDIILDIGCGIGQFSLLLAANGMSTIAIDGDQCRYDALVALKETTAFWDKTIAARIAPACCRFPVTIQGINNRKSFAFFSSFLSTISPEAEREIVRSLRQFTAVILDIKQFGRMFRVLSDHQQELLDLLKTEGFSEPELIMDWELGRYMLVRPL